MPHRGDACRRRHPLAVAEAAGRCCASFSLAIERYCRGLSLPVERYCRRLSLAVGRSTTARTPPLGIAGRRAVVVQGR
jgi:hypothetical protein